MRWKYKVLSLPASHEMDEEVLNIQGDHGWELVSVLLDADKHRLCYFRRPHRELERGFDIPDAKTQV